jgi:hypothetical protein
MYDPLTTAEGRMGFFADVPRAGVLPDGAPVPIDPKPPEAEPEPELRPDPMLETARLRNDAAPPTSGPELEPLWPEINMEG